MGATKQSHNMEKNFYLTKQGLSGIKKQYEAFQKLKRSNGAQAPEISHSDDVNLEYLSFLENLDSLDSKITETENILKNACLIKIPPKKERDIVGVGATVLVNIGNSDNKFQIVGTLEANPLKNRISNESPMGMCLLGKRKGDAVKIQLANNNVCCKIKKIEYRKI